VSARSPTPDSAERLYALLLRAYPAALRERFGSEMRQLFCDRRRDAAKRGEGAARFWLELAADIVRSLPAQHLAALRERRSARPAEQPDNPFPEKAMIFRKLVGGVLVALALIHIVADAVDANNSMGALAILVTLLTLAAGAAILRYPRWTA
jgi:hypothetical protein